MGQTFDSTAMVCVILTVIFCLCVRGFMVVVTEPPRTSFTRRKFNSAARRIQRQYAAFAFATLACVALTFAVQSF